MEEKISDMLGEPSVEENAAPIPEAQAAEPVQPQAETQEQAEQRARDERGRFVAKEAAEPQPTEEQPVKSGDPKDDAFAAMRRKIAELEGKLNTQPQPEPQQPQSQEEIQHVQYLNASEQRTRLVLASQYGNVAQADQMLQAAKAYYQQLPPEQQRQISFSEEPYATLVLNYQEAYAEHQQRQAAKAYYEKLQALKFPTNDPDKIDEWALQRARELAAEQQGAAQSQKPAQQPPPTSILHMPAAGRGHDASIPTGGDMLAEVFGR